MSVGSTIPAFRARDQHGQEQDFSSLRGPKGAVFYFNRSADWCFYCRTQLVQLQRSLGDIGRNGMRVVAVSFDKPEVLTAFAREKGIGFTMLADPDSTLIRQFGLLDESVLPDNPAYGVALHGLLIVDENGKVLSREFVQSRPHSSGLVVSEPFGSPFDTHSFAIQHDHLRLRTYASKTVVAAGDTVTLYVEVDLGDGVHIRSADAERYPTAWELRPAPLFVATSPEFPKAQAQREDTGPIYESDFRVSRQLSFGATNEQLQAAAATDEGQLVIRGTFSFQACAGDLCYPLRNVPVEWRLLLADAR